MGQGYNSRLDESLGAIKWIPKKSQTDMHRISVMVSDGYTKDEQIYEVYSNHLPTIISNTPRMALVGELFKYQVRVEDLNESANLKYTLIKGPHGMQLDKSGKILWVPKAAQINYNDFDDNCSFNNLWVNLPARDNQKHDVSISLPSKQGQNHNQQQQGPNGPNTVWIEQKVRKRADSMASTTS